MDAVGTRPGRPRQPQPLRLPPVEDRLDDVRREAGERRIPAANGRSEPV